MKRIMSSGLTIVLRGVGFSHIAVVVDNVE